jgi:hypothetical protein
VKFNSRQSLLQAAAAGPVQEKIALRPPHPEIPPTFWEQYHWWIVVTAGCALGIIVLVIWLARRPKAAVVIPIEIKTREELEALRHQPQTGEILSAISHSLQRYLAIAFELPAGEFTTAEWNRLLTSSQTIGPRLSTQLIDFFQRCDRMKFSPMSETPAGIAQSALELLEASEHRRAELRAAAAPPPTA